MPSTGVPRAGEGTSTPLDTATEAVSITEEHLPCRYDPDLWFAETPAELEKAKSLCADCPLKAECLAGALTRGEPWGVWGGEILDHGAVIARKRPRGRPRKHPVPEQRTTAGTTERQNTEQEVAA